LLVTKNPEQSPLKEDNMMNRNQEIQTPDLNNDGCSENIAINPLVSSRKLQQMYENDIGIFFAELAELPTNRICAILMELPSDIFEEAFSRIPQKKMAKAMSYLASDRMTDFLQRVKQYDVDYAKNTYHLLSSSEQTNVTKLSKFEPDQAGAYMQVEMLVANLDETMADIKQKTARFRKEHPDSPIYKLFVIDEQQKLSILLHYTDMILFEDQQTVRQIMAQMSHHHHKPLSVHTTTSVDQVVRLFEEYDLTVLAVVDENQCLQGRIVFDDVYDLIRAQEQDQALMMAGTDQTAEDLGFTEARKARLNWIFVNLVALFCAASVVGIYKQAIEQLVALAVLMPVVAALGGNVGNQAVTVTVRKLALGQIGWQNASAVIKREVKLAAFNSVIVGGVVALITFIFFQQFMLGVVIALAVMMNLTMAGLVGTLIPLTIKRFGGDPAIASPLLLTTITDALGFFFFLGLAQAIML